MTVDPAMIRDLAKLLCAATDNLPSVRNFDSTEAEAMTAILDEITVADLEPAVRAAAYRLAARQVAGRG